jgi:hypothetical protein
MYRYYYVVGDGESTFEVNASSSNYWLIITDGDIIPK